MERTGPLTRPDVSEDGFDDAPSPAPPAIEQIGRFRVIAKLGEGGMGVVYAAHDADLDRPVAIKLLRPSPSDPQPARARLLREARAMAKLSHPNVITIYEVGTEGESIFIAMELVRGINLRRWLAIRPRTWRAAVECFVDAGRGLAAAHHAGIIHRDFKPDNVLVGEDGRVRVLDFGLARPSGSEDEPTPRNPSASSGGVPRTPTTEHLTQTGAVIGTPAYMAPEQWRGSTIEERTDQFSFCVALWEALFGSRPFAGDAPTALAARVMSGEIRNPTDPGDVPPWLMRVLRRGLSAAPEDRYPSMDVLLDVLARLRRESGEQEAPVSVIRPAVTGLLFARRYEIGAAAPGAALLIGRDRLTKRTVAIERIGPISAEPTRVAKLAALANLRHPNVATVLDHCIADGSAYLVSEHHEGAPDLVEWGRDQPQAIQLALTAQLLRAVAYLHAHELVHTRLAPRSVRVVDGQVKVGDLVACVEELVGVRGVPAYVAPEVLLGEGRGPLADLFSVGVLAHELLTGRRPHRAAAAGELVDEAITTGPTITAVELEEPLAAVLRRLLDPDPRQRFGSAAEALRALVATARGSLTVETVETRECALRSARFAGREAQMGQLVNALRRSLDGAGEMWLLGGESGIGKSRLLDEIGAQALARGATVIRGPARAEGGRPYEIWREVFRLLALATPDEAVASVLAPLVADIDRLRGQAHKPAPELDAKNTQQRLGRVVASATRALATPLVLLFDDLQWAGSESIDLLQRLAPRLAGVSVLVVGGYRNDEMPLLPESLPEAKTLALGPLDSTAITELAVAMTGAEGSELHALLMRETEGHALLFVEVMRFLAEEAGDLHGVATMEIPAAVAAGGVRRAMRRRLERVEAWARPVLEVAAVAGRNIDTALLGRFADADEVTRTLAHATDCAVLEHDGEHWRFRHDKLREHLLAEIAEPRRRELHHGIGDAIRTQYGADESHVQAMAHHFREAGELADEARCSGIAGEQALANGAYRDAARLLSRAIELRGHVELERVDLVRWHRMLGEAHYVLGDLSRAVEGLGGALRELGRALPQSRAGWMFLLLRLLLAHVFLMVLPGRFVARKPQRRDELHEGANAAGRIANLATYSGDVLKVLACSLLSANLAERAGRPSAYSLAVMGYSASYIGLSRLADRYFLRASTAAIEQDDPTALVEATQMECAYRLGTGEFERCKQLLEAGYAAAERADYQLGLALAEGFVGQCEYHLGNFQAMLAHYARARELLTVRSPEHEHSFLCGEAHALCMLGRFDDAQRVLTRVAQSGSAQYLLGEAFVLATRSYLCAWGPQASDALAAALATNRHVASHAIAIPPPCGHVLTGPAEALLTAIRLDPRGEAIGVARKHALALAKWGRRHPVGEAPALLFAGQLAAHNGDATRAIDSCERALVSATRLGLRFNQAQAELELGRMRGPASVPGRGHLERARDLCIRCGAGHHRKLVETLLEQADGDAAELHTGH